MMYETGNSSSVENEGRSWPLLISHPVDGDDMASGHLIERCFTIIAVLTDEILSYYRCRHKDMQQPQVNKRQRPSQSNASYS